MDTRELGRLGEDVAAGYLQAQGYTLVQRNVFTPFGELDIVARKDNVLVFVEVKCRRSNRYGPPCAGVDRRKQRRIYNAAQHFLCNFPEASTYQGTQIDVIEVYLNGAFPTVNHIPCAVLDDPNFYE